MPFVECEKECDLFKGLACVRFIDCLPDNGVDFVLGNDLMKDEKIATPVLAIVPIPVSKVDDTRENFPLCVSIRSMVRAEESRWEEIFGRAAY